MVWFSKRTLLLVMDVMPQGTRGRCNKWSEEVRYCCSLYANRNFQTKMIGLPANRFVAVLAVYFKTSELQLMLYVRSVFINRSDVAGHHTELHNSRHTTSYNTIYCTCVFCVICICTYAYVHTLFE